jgi:hypothetical protein
MVEPLRQRETKVVTLIALCGAIVWLGGYNIRALLSLYLIQFGTLEFKPMIHPYVERTVFALISQSGMIDGIGYIVVWIAGIVFLVRTPLKLKQEGWLMMSAVLFYVFTPVEVYTMVLDVQMWLLDHAGSNDLVEFRKLFIHRLGALSGVPLIALMCYYTAIGVMIFKPLRKKDAAAE